MISFTETIEARKAFWGESLRTLPTSEIQGVQITALLMLEALGESPTPQFVHGFVAGLRLFHVGLLCADSDEVLEHLENLANGLASRVES